MKLQIKKISGIAVHETGLDDRIIEFDKANMADVLAEAGQPFSEEKRRKTFERSPTLLVAFRDQRIIAYLEYCRSWDNPEDVYISSLQVAPAARGGSVMLSLFRSAREEFVNMDFSGFVSAVHRNNRKAIRLYRALGFDIEEESCREKSLYVSAPKEILFSERVLRLVESKTSNGE